MKKARAIKASGALRVLWSPVNQAFFLLWFDQVLGIFNEKADAVAEFNRLNVIPSQLHTQEGEA
jgi:hypothetical protein